MRAAEKRLAELLSKHALSFLGLLKAVSKRPRMDRDMMWCFSMMLEDIDSNPVTPDYFPDQEGAGWPNVLTEMLHSALLSAACAYAPRTESLAESSSTAPAMSDASMDADSPVAAGDHAGRDWHPQDIVGACRTTMLRGESDVTHESLNVIACNEATVYVLAPMHNVLISSCNGCIVMVGACGSSLRVEHCEGLHIVAAATRLTIANCRDCTFNIAVNSQPLLAGDNRFIQLAPFNASYEHQPQHLRQAGVARAPDHWNAPLELAREPYQLPAGTPGRPMASEHGATCPVYLMPPSDFLPFMVPFTGGPGALCGGACTEAFQWTPRGGKEVGHPYARPNVFPMQSEYQSALTDKINKVAAMRAAVKNSYLDNGSKQEVQAVIQAYFKEWLTSSNNIRQVYDLARLEKEHAKSQKDRHGSRSKEAKSSTSKA